jgi:hypothetical protein
MLLRASDIGSPERTAETPTAPRKPYRSPKLECYGELHRITRGKGSTRADTGPGNSKQLLGP